MKLLEPRVGRLYWKAMMEDGRIHQGLYETMDTNEIELMAESDEWGMRRMIEGLILMKVRKLLPSHIHIENDDPLRHAKAKVSQPK